MNLKQELKSLFIEILRIEDIDVNDNFYDNGGTSLLLIRLVSEIYKRYNKYIRAGETFTMTNIPNGTYFIKTFSDNDWNPDKEILGGKIKGFFNWKTGFSKSDRPEDLLVMKQTEVADEIKYSIHTITLYKVRNGNMESEAITADDFFETE